MGKKKDATAMGQNTGSSRLPLKGTSASPWIDGWSWEVKGGRMPGMFTKKFLMHGGEEGSTHVFLVVIQVCVTSLSNSCSVSFVTLSYLPS